MMSEPTQAAVVRPAAVAAPLKLVLHAKSRVLEVEFDGDMRFRIPFELLRIYSPSAEVRGHGPGEEVLQTGKRDVAITALQAVGNYAVQPTFSDGHDTGIYTWDYLFFLGYRQDALWADYNQRLAAAGVSRDAPMPGKPAAPCAGR